MKVYHGTSRAKARQILKDGILPRAEQAVAGDGNWKNCPSMAGCVYLTDTYVPYFAGTARRNQNEHMAVLEIDLDLLNVEDDLFPDEDFLEQASRSARASYDNQLAGLGECKNIEERTLWFRKNIGRFQNLWSDSLFGLGTLAHAGKISTDAITRVSFFNPKTNPMIMGFFFDPTITLMNYAIVGGKYKAMTRWFFEDDVRAEEVSTWGSLAALEADVKMKKQAEESLRQTQAMLDDRGGLRVVDVKR